MRGERARPVRECGRGNGCSERSAARPGPILTSPLRQVGGLNATSRTILHGTSGRCPMSICRRVRGHLAALAARPQPSIGRGGLDTAGAVVADCVWGIRSGLVVRTFSVVIEVSNLTKRYGSTVAVRDLSFTVQPGHVTGFLGPNGSGKSTTMRVILGLDTPTAGEARVGGRRYVGLRAPLREVGALLDARAVHPGRTAQDHLRALARTNRIPKTRVDEVLGAVGLSDVAGRRAGGFSLGMSQRLGIAAALLGDPGVLLFDEPVNGLDTEGIRWIRTQMKGLAADGRTVFVSSHLMSEMELTADRLVVIGGGRLIVEATVAEFIDSYSQEVTVVRSPAAGRLREVLERAGGSVALDPGGGWRVTGLDPATVGETALANGVAVHELRRLRSSLEDVYSQLTDTSVEYRATARGANPNRRRPSDDHDRRCRAGDSPFTAGA